MFTALRKSRGYGKFKRDRGAMIALAIIAVYFVVAGWIFLTEGLAYVGDKTGWFNAREDAILGAMLPERTLERVGPRWLAGFGIEQEASRRTDQADFVFKMVDQGLQAVDRLPPDLKAEKSVETLATVRLAERRLAEVPIEELRSRRDAAAALFGELDQAKKLRGLQAKLTAGVENVNTAIAGLKTPAADVVKQRDDASRLVEELGFLIEDVSKAQGQTPDAETLDEIQTSADAIRQGKPISQRMETFLKHMPEIARVQSAKADQVIEGSLAKIEPAIEQLMPMPTGLRGTLYQFRLLLGTDDQGRSILLRAVYSAKIAIQVGVVVALFSVVVGALLGSAAAYYGGWVDSLVTWLYSTLSSLPQLVLLAVLSFMFLGSTFEGTLVPIYVALGLTFWIGSARVIRGEVLKIKELEYVQAGRALGYGRLKILVQHIIPNTMHLIFINFSLLFIGAIKTEVILTFLGLGVKEGASWGLMISQAAPEVINGIFWQIGAATVFMLVLVMAFNIVSDALQDAFDPKHVG
jgi:peptide/nickel transport system permease protein